MKNPKPKPVKKPTDSQAYDAMSSLENTIDDLMGLAEVLCDLADAFSEPQNAGITYLSRRLRDHCEAADKARSLLWSAVNTPALARKRLAELAGAAT